MPAVRRKPTALSELVLLQREINQLIERLTRDEPAETHAAGEWIPSVDVFDCDGCLHVVVEVPGLAPEALRIVCKGGSLVVSGERRRTQPDGSTGFLCLERPSGRFSRTIPIGAAVDLSQAQARLRGGLLRVLLPRREDRRGRAIEIPVVREEVSGP